MSTVSSVLFKLFPAVLLCLSFAHAFTFEETSAKATAARTSNNLPEAIELYKQAVQLNPKWGEGWWYLATLQYERDQHAGARDAFRRVVELTPRAAPAWGLLGLCEFQTGEFEAAYEHIERGLALGLDKQPQMGDVLRFHRGMVMTRIGMFDQALASYVPFVRAGVQNPDLVLGLGLAGLRMPLVPREVAERDRELIRTAGQAISMVLSGRPQEAEEILAGLAARFGAVRNVHYLYGTVILQRDPDRSLELMKRELELHPENSAALGVLSLSLLLRGDTAAALKHAQKAFALDAKSPNLRYILGRALVDSGKAAEGIAHLEAAVKMDPSNLESLITLAAAYPKAGRYADAKRARQAALELSKGAPDVARR